MKKLHNEQRTLGVDISSDEEGNNWDGAIDKGVQHPPLKKMRTDDEGQVRSSSTVPRDRVGVKDDQVRKQMMQIIENINLVNMMMILIWRNDHHDYFPLSFLTS